MSVQTVPRKSQSSKPVETPSTTAADLPPSLGNTLRASTTDETLIRSKLQRIQNGGEIRYMDMFAGCGGISLGFLTAGFTPVASIEMDPWAAKSHGANFGSRSVGGDKEAHHSPRDAVTETADSVFGDLGLLGATDHQIDVLVGGPPCQAFARVGRAKLREQARLREEVTADQAFLVDGRVSLWERYVAFIRATKPVALLMENVPDILNHGGTNVAELVSKSLAEEGYDVAYTLLNSAWYGVPQMRERMILVGIHRAAGVKPRFPVPTHHLVLPSGYISSKNAARRVLKAEGSAHHRWVPDPAPDSPAATTASDALADLPPRFARDLLRTGGIRRGAKDPSEAVEYITAKPTTAYSRLMREWNGFATKSTTGHIFRYLPRDYKIFAEIQPGWEYPQVHAYVEHKIATWLANRKKRGLSTDPRNPDVISYIADWRIPYDPGKFPNKWWKLRPDAPVRTLMAHLGKDSYSHIHFDSEQARTITVREAARLQSFPDGFVFKGSMNPAFKQIGNAVPPLFAYAIARGIRECLGAPETTDMRVTLFDLNPSQIKTTEGTK
ncbi:DNA cytosine methyltransferase [Uliginosibacterium aquaticum]|uniref:DNA (cytosine-5-)-methyltransferase n=1 Tax=Uliginosibacterium aquaticum TaxID=2731212 RepID=A0ABX2IMZ1_9RHOO|nr:DNA cytosine methyltransferase [Uliginosibacterium aquaticum]NSL55658.1 DNA cytosine methyltransferase [Uliginosibacterium aquaticum]